MIAFPTAMSVLRLRGLGLLVVTAIIASACGGDVASPSPTASSASAAPTPVPAQAYPPDGPAPCHEPTAADPAHRPYDGQLRRIRTTDARTVVFELCDPDVTFRSKVALPAFAIQDAAWLQAMIDPTSDAAQPITREVNGLGPYALAGWDRGSAIRLSPVPDRPGTPPGGPLEFRWNADDGQRAVELVGGVADAIDGVSADVVPVIEGSSGQRLVARPPTSVFYVGMNQRFAPFTDVRVRRAIAIGIDRTALAAGMGRPGTVAASHVTPCAVPNGCEGDPWPAFDAAAGRELLAAAGFPDGFTTTIQYRDAPRAYLPDPTAAATALAAQLEEHLGITATLEPIPADTYLPWVDEGNADGLHLLGRVATVADVAWMLDPLLGAGASAEFGDVSPAIADALADGHTLDPDARRSAYRRANDAIRTEVPLVPIAWLGAMTASHASLGFETASPWYRDRLADLQPDGEEPTVWMTPTEPEGLYCADETDPGTELICAQVGVSLTGLDARTGAPTRAAATCESDVEATAWTCTLREDLRFHDGATLDAGDVLLTFAAQWDAEHPLHRGRSGEFARFASAFGDFLHAPAGP